ncbi:MAG TPA: adenine phosphoribosyltransferase, partial [Patescibacteria group bacterium]|nr:adenine phosphoribosyltransferase [Patescibacteria group bacterium]
MYNAIKEKIRTIPHWPKQGIMFRDITTLFKDADGLQQTIHAFVDRYRSVSVDVVVGIESRGFILGAALAHAL